MRFSPTRITFARLLLSSAVIHSHALRPLGKVALIPFQRRDLLPLGPPWE